MLRLEKAYGRLLDDSQWLESESEDGDPKSGDVTLALTANLLWNMKKTEKEMSLNRTFSASAKKPKD